MSIEMLMVMREYYKMAAPWRWLARQMFPVIKVIAWQPEENENAIARWHRDGSSYERGFKDGLAAPNGQSTP